MLTMHPTLKISFGFGSSVEASCCVARKIFLSPAIASSRARTLDSRPTTKGVIMYGKMTTSRIGIMGRRLVSDLSREVSMFLVRGNHWTTRHAPAARRVHAFFFYCMTDGEIAHRNRLRKRLHLGQAR